MAAVVKSESSFKSFMRPTSLWSKSKALQNSSGLQNQDPKEKTDGYFPENPGLIYGNSSSSSLLSSFSSFGRKSTLSSSQSNVSLPKYETHNVALKETAKGEVYKLSMIDQYGSYMPPSPCAEGKRDHWIDIRDDIMDFNIPNSTCLTTHSRDSQKHDFFTPYIYVQTQPYVTPVDTLSDYSSSFEDNDSSSSLSRSSSVY